MTSEIAYPSRRGGILMLVVGCQLEEARVIEYKIQDQVVGGQHRRKLPQHL